MQLRDKDVFYITDVELAILEPDGKLSILKKAEKSVVTVEDLNIKKPQTGMMTDLILDGNILLTHLKHINKDKACINKQLKARKINNIQEAVYRQTDRYILLLRMNSNFSNNMLPLKEKMV